MNLLILHFSTCMFMTGLIWFVQVVHYPLFAIHDERSFSAYETSHIRRTGYVVVPVMILELLSAVLLLLQYNSDSVVASLFWLNAILLATIWALTFFVQVPQHNRLQQGFSPDLVAKLVFWNWPRTLLWSGRSCLLLYALPLLN